MTKLIDKIKDRSENASRGNDTGLVNSATGASLLLDEAGNATIAASKLVQYKLNRASGYAKEVSLESETLTNRKRITTDEIVVNNHKLNPQIYELTDMKPLYGAPTYSIGNLTVDATVLVKSWEPNLKKWVLIRRPMRTPLFMNALPIAKAPEEMDINDDITSELKEVENKKSKRKVGK